MWSFFAALIKPLTDWLQRFSDDAPRKEILRNLLTNRPPGKEWRSMKTLSRSIGADEKETARLLIKVGARRSTGEADMWALRADKPL
jgi:hypothetical protein